MKKIALIAFAATCLGSVAHADELLLTSGAAKSGSSIAVDYVSDGRSVGLQLNIRVPVGGTVDTSRFAKALPAGFVLDSNIVDGKLIAMIVNDQSKPFPAGVVSFGVLSSKGGKGDFTLESMESVDANAQQISVKSVATDSTK